MRALVAAVLMAVAAGIVGSGYFGGTAGLAGFGLGVGASAFNLAALWGITELGARSARSEETARTATGLVVLAFFAKLPVFLVLAGLTWGLTGAAPTCFLVGLGLVYSAFVGWALARR